MVKQSNQRVNKMRECKEDEKTERYKLEVDDLKQYLTGDKIKMEYINN